MYFLGLASKSYTSSFSYTSVFAKKEEGSSVNQGFKCEDMCANGTFSRMVLAAPLYIKQERCWIGHKSIQVEHSSTRRFKDQDAEDLWSCQHLQDSGRIWRPRSTEAFEASHLLPLLKWPRSTKQAQIIQNCHPGIWANCPQGYVPPKLSPSSLRPCWSAASAAKIDEQTTALGHKPVVGWSCALKASRLYPEVEQNKMN